MTTNPRRSYVWHWLALAAIAVSFCAAVLRLHPTNFFGYTEDDSIYFSSAKALAEGKGYVLASFPGTPAATKYPIFYPWLLSWVWHWNPSFPSNLTGAIGITIAFGVLYVFLSFLFLGQFKTLTQIEALMLTAFCALHPLVLFYSASVLSEIPFAALALGAMLLSEEVMQPTSLFVPVVCCGIVTGLCILTRTFGVPVAAGIILAGVIRRSWKQLLVFGGSIIPSLAILCWQTVSSRDSTSPVSGPAASSLGWVHTWAYYSSYPNVWRIGVPTRAIFFIMLRNNLVALFGTPAAYFISPLVQGKTLPGTAAVVLVTGAAVAGIFRDARDNGFRTVHFVLPFYLSLVVLWNYPSAPRFLIPLLPLFAAGLWLEAKRILAMSGAALRAGEPLLNRLTAVGFSILLAVFALSLLANYFGKARTFFPAVSRERAALLVEKRQVYDWLAHQPDRSTRVVAYEDGSLYLYTGHQSTRPYTFTTAEFYDPRRLDTDLEHFCDVPRAIKAAYWVSAEDDYGYEWPAAYAKGRARMRDLERVLPLVFQSQQTRVKIYSLDCRLSRDVAACNLATNLLPSVAYEPSVVAVSPWR